MSCGASLAVRLQSLGFGSGFGSGFGASERRRRTCFVLERLVTNLRCNAERFDCYSCVQEQEKVPRYIRGDFAGFRALGVRKVDALLPILRRGVHVVLSDVDCVWLHDPNPMVRGLVPGCADTYVPDPPYCTHQRRKAAWPWGSQGLRGPRP